MFCLTIGSAITGPYRKVSMLGLFTKMAALGIISGAPVFWYYLKGSSEIPALYPTVDLFTAPFLASIAVLVDEALHNDPNVGPDDDDIFLSTFTFLACLAILLAGSLMALAGVFRLANLGSFLPFSVLAGFFAAVGVLTWTLALKVDTQMSVSQIVFSGDWKVVKYALLHHAPSFIIASLMKYLGRYSPFYVIGLVLSSIFIFYACMFSLGMSMETAIEEKWFWSQSDLVYDSMNAKIGFQQWAPPAPFGIVNSLWQGKVHWGAVARGLEPTIALSFLYLIRCSIHGAALKKNVPTLARTETVTTDELDESISSVQSSKMRRPSFGRNAAPHARHFSEVIDLEQLAAVQSEGDKDGNGTLVEPTTQTISHKPTTFTLKEILTTYGKCQVICGLVGSFGVVPSVAASPTMYMVSLLLFPPTNVLFFRV